jgi:hypothetical protein
MVLGGSNCPNTMDLALRCAGQFNCKIILGAPDKGAREHQK